MKVFYESVTFSTSWETIFLTVDTIEAAAAISGEEGLVMKWALGEGD